MSNDRVLVENGKIRKLKGLESRIKINISDNYGKEIHFVAVNGFSLQFLAQAIPEVKISVNLRRFLTMLALEYKPWQKPIEFERSFQTCVRALNVWKSNAVRDELLSIQWRKNSGSLKYLKDQVLPIFIDFKLKPQFKDIEQELYQHLLGSSVTKVYKDLADKETPPAQKELLKSLINRLPRIKVAFGDGIEAVSAKTIALLKDYAEGKKANKKGNRETIAIGSGSTMVKYVLRFWLDLEKPELARLFKDSEVGIYELCHPDVSEKDRASSRSNASLLLQAFKEFGIEPDYRTFEDKDQYHTKAQENITVAYVGIGTNDEKHPASKIIRTYFQVKGNYDFELDSIPFHRPMYMKDGEVRYKVPLNNNATHTIGIDTLRTNRKIVLATGSKAFATASLLYVSWYLAANNLPPICTHLIIDNMLLQELRAIAPERDLYPNKKLFWYPE